MRVYLAGFIVVILFSGCLNAVSLGDNSNTDDIGNTSSDLSEETSSGSSGTASSGGFSEIPTFVEDFIDTIDESIWQIAAWTEHYGQTGRERCYAEDGYLNMIFIYNPEGEGYEQYLSSAIQTREEYSFGRWEARLKPTSESGVLNSFYTIDWDDFSTPESNSDGTKQEIDIELLTFAFGDNSGKVHFAVHAHDHDSFNTNPDVALDFNPSDDFHVWGMDISPTGISWFVDDTVLLNYRYDEHDVTIDTGYQVKLNAWTSKRWVQGPPTPNVECKYQIDWIKYYPWVED